MRNKNLNNAKSTKQNEFYTQFEDIDKELKHYKKQLKGKIIYCNCDDPYKSNFFKYFVLNFNELGLKKLIATSFKDSPLRRGLWESDKETKKVYKIELNNIPDDIKTHDDVKFLLTKEKNNLIYLRGDGDFRSKECIETLKTADIIITNPPFSLFKEYVSQLIEYSKKFLILGNLNVITHKEIFRFIKENKIQFGYCNGAKKYMVPSNYNQTSVFIDNGIKYITMGNTVWFTNLDVTNHHEPLTLYKKYNSQQYPKYDNYNAIEVSKVEDIPLDYNGIMDVPITFMDKYCVEQFEIIGKMSSTKIDEFNFGYPFINGERKYNRILIRVKQLK